MFLVATMGGLGLGLAAAILLGMIDSRVRFPHQVTDGLGLPILGALPRFSRRKGALGSDDLIQVLEALRSIRLSLAHSFGTAGPLISVVTSTGAGDGKSFVTSNLGLAFAELGKRTIIIDADIRRGTLHTLTGVPRKPGLCDYLVSNAPLGDVILSTSHAGLDVIPRGSSLTNGPELLASGTMRELLADLRQRYDVILLDSSPLGAAADALVLGTLTGNLVMVVRNDVTDRTLAEAQLRNVDRLPIRILGAVLNAVPRNGVYRYYSYIPNYGTLVSEGAIAALGRDSGNGADSGNGHPRRPNGSSS
jgi:capsular exopolysaccharide synthesis family protein